MKRHYGHTTATFSRINTTSTATSNAIIKAKGINVKLSETVEGYVEMNKETICMQIVKTEHRKYSRNSLGH